jgi:23S rRNA (guanine2445-N2)-methyltransferase / 23S rRNA (guanine2069-N7)-methyltransferase
VLDIEETALLYRCFGDVLKTQFKHWQAAMIISDPELGFRLGIRSQKPITFFNGALECKLKTLGISFIAAARREFAFSSEIVLGA